MWFKHLRIYKCLEHFSYTPESLAKQLAAAHFTPCANLTPLSYGWVAPFTKEETLVTVAADEKGETSENMSDSSGVNDDEFEQANLVYAANGCMLLCLKSEKKLLPTPVIKEHVEEKIKHIERSQQRKVGKKEKQSIKEEVYFSLLPKAFTTSSLLYAYFDIQQQLLIVDAATPIKAELFITYLRKALGSLKVEPLDTDQSPASILTDWLQQPNKYLPFEIADHCTLQDLKKEKGLIRCQHQDLLSNHIQAFLAQPYQVNQLQLCWLDQLQFSIHHDLSIHQIKSLQSIKDIADEAAGETAADRFDANFAIMTGTVRELLKQLLPFFTPTPERIMFNDQFNNSTLIKPELINEE